MTLSDFYNEMSRHVDTEKTEIGVADTKRVLSEAFKLLAGMPTAEALDLLSKGISTAQKKRDAK